MLSARKRRQVASDFGGNDQRGGDPNSVDARQIHAQHLVERDLDVEFRRVSRLPGLDPLRFCGDFVPLHLGQLRLDHLVTGGDLRRVGVIDPQGARHRHDLLRQPLSQKGSRYLLGRRLHPNVAQRCQLLRAPLSVHNCSGDRHPAHPRDVREHVLKRHVHLRIGLLYQLDLVALVPHQIVPCPHQRPDRHDLPFRSEGASQQSERVKLLDPLAVQDIRLSPRHVLHMPRIHQCYLESRHLQDVVHRDPVDPRRLHGHLPDPARLQPLHHLVDIGGEASEFPHRRLASVRRDRHEVASTPDINPRHVRIDHRQLRNRASQLLHVLL